MCIAFIIWSMVAILFIGMGITCAKTENAVGFFTFSKPPYVEDVKSYNKAVAILWIVSAAVFEIIGLPILFLQQNSPLVIAIIFAVMIWVLGLMIAYLRIEEKYKSR